MIYQEALEHVFYVLFFLIAPVIFAFALFKGARRKTKKFWILTALSAIVLGWVSMSLSVEFRYLKFYALSQVAETQELRDFYLSQWVSDTARQFMPFLGWIPATLYLIPWALIAAIVGKVRSPGSGNGREARELEPA